MALIPLCNDWATVCPDTRQRDAATSHRGTLATSQPPFIAQKDLGSRPAGTSLGNLHIVGAEVKGQDGLMKPGQ